MNPVHISSSLDDFPKEEGIFEEVTSLALLNVIAWLLTQRRMREV